MDSATELSATSLTTSQAPNFSEGITPGSDPRALRGGLRIGLMVAGLFLFGTHAGSAAGTWTALAHTAPEPIDTMLLLADGTVMAAGANTQNGWYRLTPDSQGGYANGTWTTRASMHYTRLYYSSDALTDGRVFIAGAEYGSGTNSAEVYDPLSNAWTPCPPPPAGQHLFYDSSSKILANGNVLIAPVSPATSGGTVIYVTASNTFIAGPTLFRGSYQDEASWVKLPDDSILTIDPFGVNSERYIPSLNRWINDAIVPVALYDSFGFELGGAFLLADGRAFFLGATGRTAFYTPSGGTNMGSWQAGPIIPNNQGTPDAPAAMMVDGKILCAVSPVPTSANHFPSPTSFYEFDPVANAFTQVTGPTGTTYPSSSYILRMLDLPDGTVLVSVSASQLYIYRPSGAALAAGKPAISNLVQNANGSFHLEGTLFNGISEGANYGDDAQMDSNYPLVRMTNSASGTVYYARTYNWSSTGVMTSNRLVSTEFVVPTGLPSADYSLVVVANGNSSDPIPFALSGLPPIVTVQPKDQTVATNSGVTFSVAAAGTPLSYFWQRNGAFIAGATTSSYSTNNVQIGDSGALFSCLISNVNGTTSSSNAVLTVVPGFPPAITIQPTNVLVALGGSATFNIAATSAAPLSYFWKRGGTLIAGGTNSSYTTNNVQLADSGAVFSCVVSNVFGATNSANVTLTVLAPGVPNDFCSGAVVITNASYTSTSSTTAATSASDAAPTCISGFGKGVWYVFTPPFNGTVIADTIGSSFDTGLGVYRGTCGSLIQVTCDDDGGGGVTSKTTTSVSAGTNYYFLVGGYGGASGSLVFHLNYASSVVAPGITVQPANQIVPAGGSATFNITATGTTLSYYWRRNGTTISGANTSSYTTNGVQVPDSGAQFSCLVSNAAGSALSSNALLILQPGFQSVIQTNNAIQFAWNSVSGLTYQVQYRTNLDQSDWVNLGSATAATGSVSSATDPFAPDPQRFYRVLLLP